MTAHSQFDIPDAESDIAPEELECDYPPNRVLSRLLPAGNGRKCICLKQEKTQTSGKLRQALGMEVLNECCILHKHKAHM